MTMAFRTRRNCVRDWFESLVWDQVQRIEHFFEDHFSAQARPYTRAASKNFWISMVARVYTPGCQVDNMVVLEGPQGIRKSSALRVIGGDWFSEQHESATGKGFFEVLQGKLLVEISEMDSFSRAEVTKVKQIITCTNDRFRESYGRHAQDHPRQCIFAGTTNADNWNRDETGARRFWPIACQGEIDIEAVRQVRSQCFAEAVHLFKSSATWWDMPSEETKTEQEARYQPPALVEPIQRYIDNERVGDSEKWAPRLSPLENVSVAEILHHALRMPESQWTKDSEMRVAASLRWLGWQKRHIFQTEYL
jgi:predicted P-loop ATPase